ncbi:MAG: hypothetical protein ACPGJS_05815 [Flammeovirgaceae bacterium]
MNYPVVNIPPGKQVIWGAFCQCAWDKTVEIVDPNGRTIATGYKKFDGVDLQQLRLKDGSWLFNSGNGGDFTVKIMSGQGTPSFAMAQDTIYKYEQREPHYGTTVSICTEDDVNIDKDYNDCTVLLSWTNKQG